MADNQTKTAIIIGAGPAGLTAAFELLEKAKNIKPIIFEASDYLGGIARTINYKGNRMDIGGHRFFSKSDRVMAWWQNILPLQALNSNDAFEINYQNKTRMVAVPANGPDPDQIDKVMLVRRRLSRIYFSKKFFDYPITLNFETLSNLNPLRMAKIGSSYLWANLFPIKKEKSLEDFFINRFGRELYSTFFKDYTEKVWGVSCAQIDPAWGAQRIKGLSVGKALAHFIKQSFTAKPALSQKNIETSLIQQFLYPKLGPGQMWEEVARIVQARGAEIFLNRRVIGLKRKSNRIVEAIVKDPATGKITRQTGDFFISSMPVKEFIESLQPAAPAKVLAVARDLRYRDFMTVGLLVKKLKLANKTPSDDNNGAVLDNWIYIQEPGVKISRLQIFNNWSPYLVKDLNTVWLGLEYICNVGDDLWSKSDADFFKFAIGELAKIGIIDEQDVLDGTVVRMEKAYPAYFGSYGNFNVIRDFTDPLENLFLIGRNGMHKYNNQDHSMLTAMIAAENIIGRVKTKDNIWAVNTEQDYHESQ